MPQKWVCSCGSHVPFSLSFCESCGKRWDRIGKQPHTHGKPKPRKDGDQPTSAPTADASAVAFSVPSVGVQLPSSQSSSSPMLPIASQQGASRPEAPQKTLKTLLRQQANRIGQVESRIKKLESALTQVKESWPRYVHDAQQLMNSKHRERIEFQVAVNSELVQLRQEMNTLFSQKLEDARVTYQDQQPADTSRGYASCPPGRRHADRKIHAEHICPCACTDGSRSHCIHASAPHEYRAGNRNAAQQPRGATHDPSSAQVRHPCQPAIVADSADVQWTASYESDECTDANSTRAISTTTWKLELATNTTSFATHAIAAVRQPPADVWKRTTEQHRCKPDCNDSPARASMPQPTNLSGNRLHRCPGHCRARRSRSCNDTKVGGCSAWTQRPSSFTRWGRWS